MKKIIHWIIIVVVIIITIIGFYKFNLPNVNDEVIIQNINITESGSSDLISVSYPKADDKITNPLIITGKARGNWYFEASFPVILTNWDGLIIADGIAQAEEDWMTTNYVSFTATLNFIKPSYGERGFLILKKDNPSGLSENDDSIEIPIYFK